MVLVDNSLRAKQISADVTANELYNICAVAVGSGPHQVLIAAVYRSPRASLSDSKDLRAALDSLLLRHRNIVVVGDFNVSTQSDASSSSTSHVIVDHLVLEHDLRQLASAPTRGAALLDLVFVSHNFSGSTVAALPPVAGSDHDAQLISLPVRPPATQHRIFRATDYQRLRGTLSGVDWPLFFNGCFTVDDYSSRFTDFFLAAVNECTQLKPASRRQRLPRHIVRLLHLKRRKWCEGKRSGNYDAFKVARTTARAALRQHRRNTEYRLTFARNRKAFFSHIYSKLGRDNRDIHLVVNGTDASDSVCAEAFLEEFSTNFSRSTDASATEATRATPSAECPILSLTCSEAAVLAVLKSCPNSGSSPDGISYTLLKEVAAFIVRPLNIICQQSLFTGVFPHAWKRAVVIPLYKGRGDRCSTSSYRPISLCPCMGKILEKVVQTQLVAHLSSNSLLHDAQHGFVAGKSTLSNLLTADAVIAGAISAGHPYDVLTFDFKKAFDKAPHRAVIASLSMMGVSGCPLRWFASFLSDRSQKVKVGACYSAVGAVTSGVVQGSVLGPVLYTVLADSLLRRLCLPVQAFADDIKLVADVSVYSQHVVQANIDVIANWSDEFDMPLSIDKCAVLHCGRNQMNFNYNIRGVYIQCADTVMDLGVQRSSSGG